MSAILDLMNGGEAARAMGDAPALADIARRLAAQLPGRARPLAHDVADLAELDFHAASERWIMLARELRRILEAEADSEAASWGAR